MIFCVSYLPGDASRKNDGTNNPSQKSKDMPWRYGRTVITRRNLFSGPGSILPRKLFLKGFLNCIFAEPDCKGEGF